MDNEKESSIRSGEEEVLRLEERFRQAKPRSLTTDKYLEKAKEAGFFEPDTLWSRISDFFEPNILTLALAYLAFGAFLMFLVTLQVKILTA